MIDGMQNNSINEFVDVRIEAVNDASLLSQIDLVVHYTLHPSIDDHRHRSSSTNEPSTVQQITVPF